MAELLQFVCENSDHSQILAVLKRFVERNDLAVDTNFLESLKLVLSELEKSKNLTEDLASKVLKEVCWPIVYVSSLDKDRQLSGNNRKKLHLCYDIVAFCCSVFPTTLLSEICEKSLQVLRRYVMETTAIDDNAHDTSVTLDLIGNLVRSDSLKSSHSTNVISGETGDELFLELLNILPHTTESLCGKVTGLVLPKFLEYNRTERCEAVWNVVKQISSSHAAGSATGTFNQTYAILCGLADFFFGPVNHSLFPQAEFWEIIQQGLVLNEPLTRKRSMYLLKRALDLLDKQPCDLLALTEKGNCIFYWSCDKKDSLMSIWRDYVLLMETLDEKQAHLIKPVLPRISSIVSATKKSMNGETMVDISWLFTLYHRASQHDTRFICRWAILDLLNMDLYNSPLLTTCYWRFLYGPLMSMLGEYNIYGRADDGLRGDPPPIGAAVVRFFTEFTKNLPTDNDRQSFCTGLLVSIVQQEFSQVPLVFMSQMLASLPPCKAWDSKAIGSISEIFPLFRTFNPQLSAAIQSFLLKAVINLTDPRRVAWSNIAHFLSLLSEDDCLCRGNALWEATVQWVWQIHGTVGQEDSGKADVSQAETGFSHLFKHLKARVEVFLNDNTLEISTGGPEVESVVRLVVIACDSSLRFSKNSESKQLTEGLFRQTVEVLQHATRHVYASEGRTERAARILSGILRHMNTRSTTPSQGNSSGKSDGIATATRSIDSSIGIMEELLRTSGADILELLLRKLSTAPSTFSPVDRSSAFLDLTGELFTFMAVTVSSAHGLEVYLQFIGNLVQRSRTIVLDKQSDRQKLTLSDWRSFVLAMKCLAWCSTAVRAKSGLHMIHLVQTLSQTAAELDLSSEFPKPSFLYEGETCEDTSAETSVLVKKGWGRLVSDFIEAQWQCVEFLLEQVYIDSGGRQQRDKLKPFLTTLPDAALEALSLGSGLAVVPVIRCVRLLTPQMLQTDNVLCSQAVESVWWTFQDRQKGDHIWFWGTLREMTKVVFNPCLLVLPEEHPITAIVRKYWGELLTLGEDRPGIVNHVIGPCCEFWANCPQTNDPNPAHEISEEDRKRSLEVHLDFLTEACVFGPRVKKTLRVTSYVLEYVRMLGEKREITPLYMDELRDCTRVRVNAINMLLTLNPKNERDVRLLQRVVRLLITKLDELTEEKPRSSINSYSHRRKHRVWQAILVALSQLFKADTAVMFAGEVLEETFRASVSENQVSVRNFLQWGMVLILGRYPSLEPLLWQQLIYDPDRRAGSVLSLITVAALVGEFSFSDSHSQAAYFQQAFPVILPWVLTPHVTVQAYAQVALQKMWLTCQRRNLQDVISNHSIIQSCVYFLETSKDGLRQKTRLLGDFFFLDCHPFRDFSIQTLFETLPRLAEVTDEEWISPTFFSQGSLGMRVWESSEADFRGLPLYNPGDSRLAQVLNGVYVNYDESIGEQISRRLTGQASDRPDTVRAREALNETDLTGPQSGDVQKKIVPWKVIPPDEEMMWEMQEQRMANFQKSSSGNLIVVASLIDKAPNLGGLCRTCEIFGVQTLVLGNSHVIEDVQFKSLSVSAAKWMNLEEVRMSELKSYLESMRHEGYTLVGVEQTANSVNLTRYQFPQKSLLLLGNEKEGIPVELIQMLDVCVEIPQVGVIRSLNVHVSGALLVWEYTRQRVLSGTC